MKPQAERFRITTSEYGGYKVSIHSYHGGEDVRAEDYDALCVAFEAMRAALVALLPYLSTEAQLLDYASLNEGRASGFDTASVKARAALKLADEAQNSAIQKDKDKTEQKVDVRSPAYNQPLGWGDGRGSITLTEETEENHEAGK